jgi:hypothetical protein
VALKFRPCLAFEEAPLHVLLYRQEQRPRHGEGQDILAERDSGVEDRIDAKTKNQLRTHTTQQMEAFQRSNNRVYMRALPRETAVIRVTDLPD